MSQITDASTLSVSPPPRGRMLLLARGGWVVLMLLVLTLNAMAIPRADALLQAPCQPSAPCFSGLTPESLHQLQRFGISVALLAAYQIAWWMGTTLIYSALAGLIFWRRSADRMALFCAYMLVLFGGATYTGLLDSGLRTVSPAWYWLVGVLELLGQVSVPTFFLLFPSGRFVPSWTRWSVLVFVLYEMWYVFLYSEYAGQGFGLGGPVFAALLLGLVALQVYRYWRVSTDQERQQTRWVVFGLAIALGGLALLLIMGNFWDVVFPVPADSPIVWLVNPSTLVDGMLLLIPICITVAILRSRLYDIDVIINRTLVYGSLSALLAAMYFAGVYGTQALLGALVPSQVPRQSPILIVATTLLIATLFTPLRRRLQAAVDRRFYRRKYDASRTLAAFAGTLRGEVDLRDLSERLVAVVDETMQPAHVSLWLRTPERHPMV